MSTGNIAQVAVAIETVPFTRELPNRFFGFTQESLRNDWPWVESTDIRSDNQFVSRGRHRGTKTIAGQLAFGACAEGVGALFQAALGAVDTAAGPPVVHTFTPGVLPTMTVQVGRPTIPFDYVGCMVNQWEVAFNPEDPITVQLDLVGRDESLANPLATAAYPATVTKFYGTQATFSLDTVSECVDTLTITGVNGVEGVPQLCGTADAGLKHVREGAGFRTYSGTFTKDFENLTLYNAFINGTDLDLEVEAVADASHQLRIAGKVRFNGDTPAVSGPEFVKQTVPFVFVPDGSNPIISVELTTTDAAP